MKQSIISICLFLSLLCKADQENERLSAEKIPHFDQILQALEPYKSSTLSLETGSAPRPGGSYYSQALYVNGPRGILFIAGQLPIDPLTNTVIMDPALATRQCMLNIQALLTNAGMDFTNLKKVIISISNIADVRTVCATYASFLITPPFPTLSVIAVAAMPLGSVVGIEGIATT